MRSTAVDKINRFRLKWMIFAFSEGFLIALGLAILSFFLFQSLLVTLLVLVASLLVFLLIKKPWSISRNSVSIFLNERIEELQYSTSLLFIPAEDLNLLSQLQQKRAENEVLKKIDRLKPQNSFLKTIIFFLICVVTGYLTYLAKPNLSTNSTPENVEEKISFTPIDSLSAGYQAPSIINQQLVVTPPAYTNLKAYNTSKMNVQALNNSRLSVKLQFDKPVDSVFVEINGKSEVMKLKNEAYHFDWVLKKSGFFNFRFKDSLDNSYISDVFYFQNIEDQAPEINLEGLPQYSSFEVDESKILEFQVMIKDDYGVADAKIVATVSKGSGEAVKFREEQINFEKGVSIGERSARLNKVLKLNDLKMDAGDELYFYVEATDLKSPNPNYARSETFFATIKDTATAAYATEGGMGVDLMPDYFRSQRQLIIDTEKLIEDKNNISPKEFKSRSNELGFDQKALRIKYGQFMGDETESGIAAQRHSEDAAISEENEEDILASYRHDHDNEDQQNNVGLPVKEEENDPLHDYLHNHDDPEESTLFTQSLKGKLREALNIMWDSELKLRMYKPKESLPFQYEILKRLQDIKNSARIYVHRIGFDPPPIKEYTRLSGDLKEIQNYSESEDKTTEDDFQEISKAIKTIDKILSSGIQRIGMKDRKIFTKANSEVAKLAADQPASYLQLLNSLKLCSEGKKLTNEELLDMQLSLLQILPKNTMDPGKEEGFFGRLNELTLKELDSSNN